MENKKLTLYEQETIINFNRKDLMASIFTYSRRWQKHCEKVLGLKPVMENEKGGKEYLIEKERILLPRKKKVLSAEDKKKLFRRLNNTNSEKK